jgi:hypothetical protein
MRSDMIKIYPLMAYPTPQHESKRNNPEKITLTCAGHEKELGSGVVHKVSEIKFFRNRKKKNGATDS